MRYRKALFIIVYCFYNNAPKYLLLKRKLHWKGWEFPKGGKRIFETDKMTIKREVKEETGLKILDIKKFDFYGEYKYDKEYLDRKKIIGQTYKLYAVKVNFSKEVKIDKIEHSEFKWCSFNKGIKNLKWESQRDCLKIVNKWLKNQNSKNIKL
jgi:8-oxo-dGTP pyrophosphatase MutT (NUDIX family)